MRLPSAHCFLAAGLFALASPAGAQTITPRQIFDGEGAATSAAVFTYAGERIVLRLRPEVAHAALAELGRTRDPRVLASRRAPALAALAARLEGAWFEPEFPNERPGAELDLTTFWIAHLRGGRPLAAQLDAARAAYEVLEAAPIGLVPLEPMATADAASPDAGFAGRGAGSFNVAAPNDSMWGDCYWLWQASRKDLHILEAWDVTPGDSSAIIAVIDTGVLRDHPDLVGTDGGWGNLWHNEGETGGVPGVDDDGNGYVDDTWGWDYVNLDSAAIARPYEDWRDADNDPNDLAVHGTAVAGVAAAIANNGSGVAGVAPRARIMALRAGYSAAINPVGIVDLSWASQAILYAVRNGATVINCSFASAQQPDLAAAVSAAFAAGVLVVAAAGNNGSAHYLGDRDDVISVGSTDQLDKVTLFSTRQPFVDLCAPGQSIATTTLYATGTDSLSLRTPYYSAAEAGTSFSSPMVAAAAALMQLDRRRRGLPIYPPYLAQLRITETVDNISAVNSGAGYGSGRLNVQRLLTGPPLSTAFHAGAATVGPGAILPTQSGAAWVAYATADSALLIMRAVSGDTVARLPLGARPTGGVAAADLGGGRGAGLFVALANGEIAGFRSSGAPLAGWPVDATATRGEFETMPVLGDIDGDGEIEVVWGGDDGSVWAWHVDGSRLAGFPRRAGTAGRNLRIALGDLDGLPGLEMVVASNNYAVYGLKGDGTSLPGWPVTIGNDPTAPVIMRLGSQPAPVVVVAADTLLRAYGANGAVRFRKGLPSPVVEDLAVGDLNGDGRDEIVVLMENQIGTYDSTGTAISARTLTVRTGGPPLVGPLATGSGANVLFASPDNRGRSRYIALTGTLTDLARWPKAGHPSSQPSMADVDGDGATEIAAGSGADSLIYLYDAGAGTWRPGSARWATPRGNFARTGSRLDGGILAVGDDVGPAAIGDLAGGELATHAVTLRWSAPADPGAPARVAKYEVRMSAAPILASNFTAAAIVAGAIEPAAPGAAESLQVSGLPEATRRWFAIRSRDQVGNWSAISNVILVELTSEYPAAISDLRVIAGTDTSLTLGWSASGDDGLAGEAARYQVRLSTTVMDSAAFANATLGVDLAASQAAGHLETLTIGELLRGQRYWIGVRAIDAAGNASALSNTVAPTVGRLARIAGVAMLPTRSPSRTPVEIEWQGDPAWSSSLQRIQIFDLGGRFLNQLTLPHQPSGVVVWDGRASDGHRVRPGVYFARFESGPFVARGRIVLLQ